MENKINVSKINKVKRDLRALKSSSHAIERLIEAQGIHFIRIRALEALPKSERITALVEKEMEIINDLGLAKEIEKNEELQMRYMGAMSALDVTDRAIVTDCYIKGKPYYKLAMDYGFSEGGIRKKVDRLIKKIALSV